MNQPATDTETLIKAAAKKVFLKKGLAGSRLEEIAEEAGIGRTALHYYFRNKEKLYDVVYREAFAKIVARSFILQRTDLTIIQKMQTFAEVYFDSSLEEPELDLFLLNEFNSNPEIVAEVLNTTSGYNNTTSFVKEIEKAVKRGELKGDPKQILISVFSMCLFAFVAKALLKSTLQVSDEQYLKLLEERKSYVMNFFETAFL